MWYNYHCTRDRVELQHSLLCISKELSQSMHHTIQDAIRVHAIAIFRIQTLRRFYQITDDFEDVLSPSRAASTPIDLWG